MKYKYLTDDIVSLYKLCPKLKKLNIEDYKKLYEDQMGYYCHTLFVTHDFHSLHTLVLQNFHPNLLNYICENELILSSLHDLQINWFYDERLFEDEYDDLSLYIRKPHLKRIEIKHDSWDTEKIECKLYVYTPNKITLTTSNIKLTSLYCMNGYRHLIY
jgi:hypothetical protein